ncbi:MAG: hydroxymethylpyrimidine/phosphomethylpyrimidine kinase, partial [Chlamydiota bacterium]|nr:hydroxymethylpyrimidine/phosphomethylpyrimidine kinase [Chlamydiota bacterium]
GMVYKKVLFEVIIRNLKRMSHIPIIVDPVLEATAGAPLIQPKAIPSLLKLISKSYLVTPNLHEASILTQSCIKNVEHMKSAAKKFHDLGAKNVLIKGGHLDDQAVDILYDGLEFKTLIGKRIDQKMTHGLGCRLSSATTALLSQGEKLCDAVSKAKRFVENHLKEQVQ